MDIEIALFKRLPFSKFAYDDVKLFYFIRNIKLYYHNTHWGNMRIYACMTTYYLYSVCIKIILSFKKKSLLISER